MNQHSIQFQADMHQKLTRYFDLTEIETMAFMLGVDFDSLRGRTKPTKVNSLFSHLAMIGRLPELLAYAREQRPNVAWPDLPGDFELPQGPAGSELDGATIYQIGTLTTQGGAFIGGGTINGSDFSNAKTVQGDEIAGNKNVLSGNFTNTLINIDSRLDRVTQTIQATPAIPPDQKFRLVQLIGELKQVLAGVPPDQAQEALNLTKRVEALAEETGSDQPDPEYINELAESLRRAAMKIAAVAPLAASIVNSIIELVSTIVA
jgi:hypothetical protein